jgi:hypothetical protein
VGATGSRACPGAGGGVDTWARGGGALRAPPRPSLPYKVDTSRPSLPYKVDTSRPSRRTNWTRLVPFPQVLCARFATAARLDAAALRAWALFRDTPPRARGCEDYAAMIRAFGAVGNVDAAVGLLKVRWRRRPAQPCRVPRVMTRFL